MGHPPTLIGLVVALAAIAGAGLARVTSIPAPVYFVAAGLAVSFGAGVEELRLPPDVVFYLFLPPLLYSAAFLTAPREARANWLAILLLAGPLVVATLAAVGGLAAAVVGALGTGGAFVLGAVLGPTDPVAATAVISRSGAPQRMRTILEGESLVNDGVALVAFSIALTAAQQGRFSLLHGLLEFLKVAAGGIAIGIGIGIAVGWARRRIHDPQIEIAISIATPYAAYLLADRATVSGVLATVAAGVYLGWRSGGIFRAESRLQSLAFWDVFVFVLTAVLFVLLGAQFRSVVAEIGSYAAWTLVWWSSAVLAAVIGVRLVWMAVVPYAVVALRLGRGWDELSPWRDRLVLGWSGIRGAVSLAAALSIPSSVSHRNVILFLTFTTILGTLVLEGVSLPLLLRVLALGPDPGMGGEEVQARLRIAEAALSRLDELAASGGASDAAIEPMRQLYEQRVERLETRSRDGAAAESDRYRRLRREVIDAEREMLDALERDGLEADVARRLERELDLDESGLRS